MQEAAATSTSLGLETEQKKGKKEDSGKTVPLYKLLSFADSVDAFLMIFGTAGAVGNGLCMLLMAVFVGEVINSFGQNQNKKDDVHLVSEVSLKFLYLALCTGVAAFLRKCIQPRKTLTLLVGKFMQLFSTFLAGFVIAFIKGWLLTLVLLSSIPLLVLAGAATAVFISKAASNGQDAYAKAAIVVEQTVGSIRTVASFTGEKQVVIKYDKSLVDAYKSGIQEGLATGFGFGVILCVIFCTYSLATWFGSKMILTKGYTGGDVLNVLIAVLIGSMSLGQASTCMTAFAAGQEAAFKIIKDNIAYGKDEATLEEIKAVVGLANAAKFIDKLPQARIRLYLRTQKEHTCKNHGSSGPRNSSRHQISSLENKDSEQDIVDLEISDSVMDLGRQSSQRMSLLRSISHGSYRLRNSSRHFGVSFGLPTGLNVPETALAEARANNGKSSKVPLRRLAHLNKPEVPVLIAGAIAAIISGSIFGLLISNVIKTFFEPPHQLKKDSSFWALMFVVLGAVSLFAYPVRVYLFSVTSCKRTKRVRSMCFEKVVRMEVSLFDEPESSSAAIGARLSTNAVTIRALVGDALALFVQDSAAAIAGLVIDFAASWQLAFIVLALIPLVGLSGYVQIKFLQGFHVDAKVFFALLIVARAISHRSGLVLDFTKAKGSAASILAILDLKSKIDTSDEGGMTLERVKGEIELHHISFKYPTRPDVQIFRDLNLNIHSGKTVALVGESGSGKSTVIALLQRFYDPESGHIMLDGIEIQRLQLKWLRQQMGLVSQETVLFNETIRANIAYGKEGNATEAETLAASELANAHHFISGLQQS
ncbi:hypothetical protein RHSIM_Rhsim13G0037100 [Rhododendron simsii]|uniref:ABC transmembrane type-1 domain-containing protein n=1 Tax=Rhododendron simsii TaxID=118357 RepID=A0A834L723_RHOSS|nr:hypothetical protein RHSIM_Rhsim13G0037100 [Rhododendron simsii]